MRFAVVRCPSLPASLIDEIDRAGGGSLALRLRQGDAEAAMQALATIDAGEVAAAERRELDPALRSVADTGKRGHFLASAGGSKCIVRS